jgi:hypothetical protein
MYLRIPSRKTFFTQETFQHPNDRLPFAVGDFVEALPASASVVMGCCTGWTVERASYCIAMSFGKPVRRLGSRETLGGAIRSIPD